MRVSFAFALLFAGLINITSVQADDDLFSEIAMESVFQKTVISTEKSVDDGNSELVPTRITGTASLIKTLQAAGFQPKKAGQQVSFEMRHASWNFPYYLSVSVETDELIIELPVVQVADPSQLDASKLLSLLSAGDSREHLLFAYNAKLGNIRIRHTASNRSVTPSKMKTIVQEMALFAETHSDAWSTIVVKGAETPKSGKTPSKTLASVQSTSANKASAALSNPTKPATKKTLVGTWSASVGNGEAFAIQIGSDRRFQLVHVKAGKSQTSVGTASVAGGQLTLQGDEKVTIVGPYRQSTNDAFDLDIKNASGKVALTLKFKRAK
ncbi:MAG: hypothetical protein HKN47_01955 [Pirellulaceae bacterium]|nr:hypothetical protein [Pirellulaceae bacterium]